MNNVAFELRKCITAMRDKDFEQRDRNLAVAITHAETALMWLNRYVFSAIGQSGGQDKSTQVKSDLTGLDQPGG